MGGDIQILEEVNLRAFHQAIQDVTEIGTVKGQKCSNCVTTYVAHTHMMTSLFFKRLLPFSTLTIPTTITIRKVRGIVIFRNFYGK